MVGRADTEMILRFVNLVIFNLVIDVLVATINKFKINKSTIVICQSINSFIAIPS